MIGSTYSKTLSKNTVVLNWDRITALIAGRLLPAPVSFLSYLWITSLLCLGSVCGYFLFAGVFLGIVLQNTVLRNADQNRIDKYWLILSIVGIVAGIAAALILLNR